VHLPAVVASNTVIRLLTMETFVASISTSGSAGALMTPTLQPLSLKPFRSRPNVSLRASFSSRPPGRMFLSSSHLTIQTWYTPPSPTLTRMSEGWNGGAAAAAVLAKRTGKGGTDRPRRAMTASKPLLRGDSLLEPQKGPRRKPTRASCMERWEEEARALPSAAANATIRGFGSHDDERHALPFKCSKEAASVAWCAAAKGKLVPTAARDPEATEANEQPQSSTIDDKSRRMFALLHTVSGAIRDPDVTPSDAAQTAFKADISIIDDEYRLLLWSSGRTSERGRQLTTP